MKENKLKGLAQNSRRRDKIRKRKKMIIDTKPEALLMHMLIITGAEFFQTPS